MGKIEGTNKNLISKTALMLSLLVVFSGIGMVMLSENAFAEAAPETRPVYITVSDNSNSQHLEDVTVLIQGPDNFTELTDGTGKTPIRTLSVGTYTITAAKTGYETKVRTETITASASNINFQMQLSPTNLPQTKPVYVSVKDDFTDQMLEGVSIIIEGPTPFTETTDSQGITPISTLEAGTYTITASKTGYVTQTKTQAFTASSNSVRIDFQLLQTNQPQTRPVTVYITDNFTKSELENASVIIAGPDEFTETTNERGFTPTRTLTAGSYTITVSKTGYETKIRSQKITTAPTLLRVDIKLTQTNQPQTRPMYVKVNDNFTKNPLEGASVIIAGPDSFTETTNSEGLTPTKTLTAGTYTITIAKTGYETKVRTQTITAASTPIRADIQLTQTNQPQTRPVFIAVSGATTDATRKPLENASVLIEGPDDFTETTNELGHTPARTLSAGTYTITVAKTGYETRIRSQKITASPSQLRIDVQLSPTTVAPATGDLPGITGKLENVRIKFDKLQITSQALANYYESTGNKESERKYLFVASRSGGAVDVVKQMLSQARENADDLGAIKASLAADVVTLKEFVAQIRTELAKTTR